MLSAYYVIALVTIVILQVRNYKPEIVRPPAQVFKVLSGRAGILTLAITNGTWAVRCHHMWPFNVMWSMGHTADYKLIINLKVKIQEGTHNAVKFSLSF